MLDINNFVTKNIGVGLVQELVQVVKSGGTVGSAYGQGDQLGDRIGYIDYSGFP